MDVGAIVKFLDRHPWVSLATGVGLTAVSVMRIRRERRVKRDLKMQKKGLKKGPEGELKPETRT